MLDDKSDHSLINSKLQSEALKLYSADISKDIPRYHAHILMCDVHSCVAFLAFSTHDSTGWSGAIVFRAASGDQLIHSLGLVDLPQHARVLEFVHSFQLLDSLDPLDLLRLIRLLGRLNQAEGGRSVWKVHFQNISKCQRLRSHRYVSRPTPSYRTVIIQSGQ